MEAPLGPPVSADVPLAAPIGEIIVLLRAGAAVPLLADDYDSLAPTRSGDIVNPGLRLAPALIDRLRLLLVAGGSHAGTLEAPGFAALAWQWQGADATTGPLLAATVAGVTLPACAAPTALDCLDDGRLRLGPAHLRGALISLETPDGVGTLVATAAELTELVVEIR